MENTSSIAIRGFLVPISGLRIYLIAVCFLVCASCTEDQIPTNEVAQNTGFCKSSNSDNIVWKFNTFNKSCQAAIPFNAVLTRDLGTWSDAEEGCKKFGGTLTTINTSEEENVLIKELPKDGICWIGLRKLFKQKTPMGTGWAWVGNNREITLNDYFHWTSDSKPAYWRMLNTLVERCGALTTAGWIEKPCFARFGRLACFICTIPITVDSFKQQNILEHYQESGASTLPSDETFYMPTTAVNGNANDVLGGGADQKGYQHAQLASQGRKNIGTGFDVTLSTQQISSNQPFRGAQETYDPKINAAQPGTVFDWFLALKPLPYEASEISLNKNGEELKDIRSEEQNAIEEQPSSQFLSTDRIMSGDEFKPLPIFSYVDLANNVAYGNTQDIPPAIVANAFRKRQSEKDINGTMTLTNFKNNISHDGTMNQPLSNNNFSEVVYGKQRNQDTQSLQHEDYQTKLQFNTDINSNSILLEAPTIHASARPQGSSGSVILNNQQPSQSLRNSLSHSNITTNEDHTLHSVKNALATTDPIIITDSTNFFIVMTIVVGMSALATGVTGVLVCSYCRRQQLAAPKTQIVTYGSSYDLMKNPKHDQRDMKNYTDNDFENQSTAPRSSAGRSAPQTRSPSYSKSQLCMKTTSTIPNTFTPMSTQDDEDHPQSISEKQHQWKHFQDSVQGSLCSENILVTPRRNKIIEGHDNSPENVTNKSMKLVAGERRDKKRKLSSSLCETEGLMENRTSCIITKLNEQDQNDADQSISLSSLLPTKNKSSNNLFDTVKATQVQITALRNTAVMTSPSLSTSQHVQGTTSFTNFNNENTFSQDNLMDTLKQQHNQMHLLPVKLKTSSVQNRVFQPIDNVLRQTYTKKRSSNNVFASIRPTVSTPNTCTNMGEDHDKENKINENLDICRNSSLQETKILSTVPTLAISAMKKPQNGSTTSYENDNDFIDIDSNADEAHITYYRRSVTCDDPISLQSTNTKSLLLQGNDTHLMSGKRSPTQQAPPLSRIEPRGYRDLKRDSFTSNNDGTHDSEVSSSSDQYRSHNKYCFTEQQPPCFIMLQQQRPVNVSKNKCKRNDHSNAMASDLFPVMPCNSAKRELTQQNIVEHSTLLQPKKRECSYSTQSSRDDKHYDIMSVHENVSRISSEEFYQDSCETVVTDYDNNTYSNKD